MAFSTFQNSPFNEGAPFVLNSGGVTLSTGFPVVMGDGTASLLWLSTNGVGVRNAGGFRHEFRSLATANRMPYLADANGTLFPALTARLNAEWANSTTSPTAVPAFEVPLEASSEYDIEGILLARTALTTTGFQFALTGPTAQTDFVAYEASHTIATTMTTGNMRRQLFTGFGSNFASNNSPVATTIFPVWIRGKMKTTGTPPVLPVGMTIQSSAASEVKLMPGSILRFLRTN